MIQSLPRASQAFINFAQILRNHGFAVSPEQTMSFMEAITLLGPRDISDIRNAGLALFSIPRERQAEYDALFRAFFMGQTIAAPTESSEESYDTDAIEDLGGSQKVELEEQEEQPGDQASGSENLTHRTFDEQQDDDALRTFLRSATTALPRRKSYRHISSKNGTAFDMRRSLKDAIRSDGEIFKLRETKRKTRQRPIVLLIDVSSSMQQQSEETMRFAHALKQVGERVEVFTFGTRLTRVTRALSLAPVDQALERVSALVADFDGGTRIGEALDALLAVPRFASTMRGASILILSDGLERGNPDLMVDCIRRLSRIAWRIDWLTPLAGGSDFAPRTEALLQAKPFLNSISDGSSIASVCHHTLNLSSNNARKLERAA